MTMKILTWNINGIRASKSGVKDVLDSLDADVICLQETKITRDMLDEPTAIVEGYNAYFSFSRKRSGYSGTANFCRDAATPQFAEEGLSGQLSQSEDTIGCLGNVAEIGPEELLSLDGEGRAVITQHQIEMEEGQIKQVAIINVYVPRAADQDERWTYKLRFLALLQSRAENLLRCGRHVIVLGDINTTHKRIDHCDPSTHEFLRPHSRQWVDQFLRPEDRDPDLAPIDDRSSFEAILSDAEGGHFIDTFRFFHPDQTEAYTNWCTVTSARQTNYGKRLDYIFMDKGLESVLQDCSILADFEGSDHCPVVVTLCCKPVPAKKCPQLCTKFMPEFQGKQQKLLSFFSVKNMSVSREKKGVERVCSVDSKASVDANTSIDAHMAVSCEDGASASSQSSDISSSSPSSSPSLPNRPTLLPSSSPSLSSPAAQNKPALSSSLLSVMNKPTLPSSSSLIFVADTGKSSPQKSRLKRTLSDKPPNQNTAKKKKSNKGDNSSNKQASLLNFFSKPSVTKSSVSLSTLSESRSSVSHNSSSMSGNTSGCHGDGQDAVSKYWNQSNTHSPQNLPCTNIKASPQPSPSKLSLPSLSLIPCKSKPSAPTEELKDATSAETKAENDTSLDRDSECELQNFSEEQRTETMFETRCEQSVNEKSRDTAGKGNFEQNITEKTKDSTPKASGEQSQKSRDTTADASCEQSEKSLDISAKANFKQTILEESKLAKAAASNAWKGLLSGPPPPPPCKGHREPCVLRTVKKVGPNKGKQFYVCARPEGHSSNKDARCDHFQWVNYVSSSKKKT